MLVLNVIYKLVSCKNVFYFLEKIVPCICIIDAKKISLYSEGGDVWHTPLYFKVNYKVEVKFVTYGKYSF